MRMPRARHEHAITVAPVEARLGLSAIGFDEVDRLTNGVQFFGLLIGDLGAKLSLELHEQLDDVEAVGVQVVGETCFTGDRISLGIGLLGNDVDDLVFDLSVRHGKLLISPFSSKGEAAVVRRFEV